MIDKLFGSKTRVKLLHLFLNNPGQSFFVREITRKIDEQINSVRRELANMLEVGIITSDNSDNKLYYQANQRYDYYIPLKAIFSNDKADIVTIVKHQDDAPSDVYSELLSSITGVKVVIFTGVLARGSTASVDILLVGNMANSKIRSVIKEIESREGRDINYSVLSYDEFYYRLSVKDKFVTEILNNKHKIIIDKNEILVKE